MIFPSTEPADTQALQRLPQHIRRAILVGAVVAAILLVPIPLTVTVASSVASSALCTALLTPDSEYDSLAAVADRADGDGCLRGESRRTEWLSLVQMITR
ncbi:hypothetical protein [Lysinibacter cavernae]|uniref:Uncharacterized protein n=1 Tax=Lysinibacter cavernae TaxID=1640652 RepID=A0A7X5R3B8_9MICO|nr:hypothetical protein [Lysinibacter cavernae]NIH54762.1 hypothetical protein [Lysinibacter cavernae]